MVVFGRGRCPGGKCAVTGGTGCFKAPLDRANLAERDLVFSDSQSQRQRHSVVGAPSSIVAQCAGMSGEEACSKPCGYNLPQIV